MSTITSPRTPSITSLQTPTTSRRPSLDTFTRSQTTSPSRAPQPNQRRNRAALRDYYGLKNAAPADVSSGLQHEDADVKESELDKEGFDAESYVQGVLEREGLDGVLRVEGGLVNEIKGLDGERKALVYDNYSKLIAATDTIRKMRMNMDPLTPTTSTLSPAIAHIAETSAALATKLHDYNPSSPTGSSNTSPRTHKARSELRTTDETAKKVQTVRWVLESPRRMRELIAEGKRGEAEAAWKEVVQLLDKWTGVEGVEEIRREGEMVLKNEDHR
ncbi:MAG: hypothetical protein M1812_000910 [Candelaria pacifica]|nr:MAG: hypothetical protein M1812_000910 [Candelaria pacifica]